MVGVEWDRMKQGQELTPGEIRAAIPESGLFRGGGIPWRMSPAPLRLPRVLVRQMEGLGHVLARFQDAAQGLYLDSLSGKEAAWLAPMLEAGKPAELVEAQRAAVRHGEFPCVIRPDLLWCADGLALAELDSVPGGMGTTLWLSRLYAAAGYDVLGGGEGMAEGFRATYPGGITIAVSDESADYRPEMEYLAQSLGEGYTCARAEELPPDYPGPLYRFFELFDLGNIPAARAWLAASAPGKLHMSPPPIEHTEEKAWLALFHMPGLQRSWQRRLRAAHLARLRQLIPYGWIPDPAPLPPQAALPRLNLHSWQDVAELGRQERRLVLKISGFDARAWGGRGVSIGHDMPTDAWRDAVQQALHDFPNKLWVMQEFREAQIIEHPYYTEDGRLARMQGRVRLCPYYFRRADGSTRLAGCLATIAPADKKKIHGMRDAVLVPCTAG